MGKSPCHPNSEALYLQVHDGFGSRHFHSGEMQLLIRFRHFRNIGVLQTTVAEMVTVKEHQRMICHFLISLFPTQQLS